MKVTAPVTEVIAVTSVAVTRMVDAGGCATARYIQGPAREFTLLLSPHFQMEEAD